MKESTISLQLRLRESTHAKLRCIAEAELRSLNAQIEYFLLKCVEDYETAHGVLEPGKDE